MTERRNFFKSPCYICKHMKLLKGLFFLFASTVSISTFAQAKTDSFAVSGECKMCKKKIETAAKAAGATYANWNVNSKVITIKYNSESSNAAKIQEGIAHAGYDTPTVKASEAAYNELEDCCKYERTLKAAAADSTKHH
jgi:periplasmic mercuric ion binding protein